MSVEPSSERAVREIATNPALKAEAAQRLPELVAYARQPAGDVGVTRVVGKRMALYPVNLPKEAMAAWWTDYCEVLADLPESALEAGMVAHIKAGGQFMPKPGELRQLALTTENRAVRAAERARAAVEYQPPRTYETTPVAIAPRIIRQEPTAEEKQRVREMYAEYSSRVEAGRPPKPAPPPGVFAKVDETGISAELRALVDREAS